jgi:hypothetical protein
MARKPLLFFGIAIMLASASDAMFRPAESSDPIELEVLFKLTDLDYKPIPPEKARVVVGSPVDWQKPGVGFAFETNAAGEHRFVTHATLEPRLRKRRTNFMDSLSRRPERTQFLQAAAELEYAGRRHLYVVRVHRFEEDGTVLLDDFSIYSPDAAGDFTIRAERDTHRWTIKEADGLVVSDPGFSVADFMFDRDVNDATGKRWILKLGFKRARMPVIR